LVKPVFGVIVMLCAGLVVVVVGAAVVVVAAACVVLVVVVPELELVLHAAIATAIPRTAPATCSFLFIFPSSPFIEVCDWDLCLEST
jgi:hypothetical protein